MLYTQMFLYLQVLDFFTTLIGFKLGLAEASPFIRALLHFGPVVALLLSKAAALVLASLDLTAQASSDPLDYLLVCGVGRLESVYHSGRPLTAGDQVGAWVGCMLKAEGCMYPLKKGKVATQAHVGLPEGTYEEEHGRKGFYGKSAHLYHAHPPTGWVRFEGKLRPHCFDLNQLEPSDLRDPQGSPWRFWAIDDVQLYVSRRSEPMPFYYRNADGDELIFVHRGAGDHRNRFRAAALRAGRLLVMPRAVTYRVCPRRRTISS